MKLLIILGASLNLASSFWILSFKCYKDLVNEDIKVDTLISTKDVILFCLLQFHFRPTY